MSHQIDTSNNRANMAYRGATPWHKLGEVTLEGDDAATITRKAGLNFEIIKGELLLRDAAGNVRAVPELNRSVLYRSDTGAPLSVMSTNLFKIVQPGEIMDFIASSVEAMGWKIETAGSLHGGRKYWALANTGIDGSIGKGDKMKGYLLAATAVDGSMATEMRFTSVRVVCNNTLQMSLNKKQDADANRVKVYHFENFDVNAVKKELGVFTSAWDKFITEARALSRVKIDSARAVKILRNVYEAPDLANAVVTDEEFIDANRTARKVLELFTGNGIGAELATASGTAWGLVNAATEYYDHAANSRNPDNRLHSAWFGAGAKAKQDIVDTIYEMV